MIVTIHQPEHLPWTGYFHKMAMADIYVFLDSVQFKKNNWQNRNRIVTRTGEAQWLTVPVKIKGHLSSTIEKTEINNDEDWRRKYIGRLVSAYEKHPYYTLLAPGLIDVISKNHTHIADLNIEVIKYFMMHLELSTPLVRSSRIPNLNDLKGTELLVEICKSLGAKKYISGPEGKKYMDLSLFHNEGIQVDFHTFSPPSYESTHFILGLSTLDLMMNHGNKSKKIIGIF